MQKKEHVLFAGMGVTILCGALTLLPPHPTHNTQAAHRWTLGDLDVVFSHIKMS